MSKKLVNKTTQNRVATAFCQSMVNFVKYWLGEPEADYLGYCWIPQEEFTELCQLLSRVSSIRNFCARDPDLGLELFEHPMQSILPVHLFSTWRRRAKRRQTELSGRLLLTIWPGRSRSEVNMIAGVTEPSVIVKFCGLFPGLRRDKELPLRQELALLFRVPVEYGREFMFFEIDGNRHQCREVSRCGAEEAVLRALRWGTDEEDEEFVERRLEKLLDI